MQCPNCSSFLPPGSQECMQCGHRLASPRSAPSASVQPPRAGKWQKRLRKIAGFYRMEDGIWRLKKKIGEEEWMPAMLFSIVPGAGHCRYGRRRQGWQLGLAWLTLLLVSVYLWGYMLAQLTVAGLLFVHIYAVLDAGLPFMQKLELRRRIKVLAGVTFLLLACVYMPLHMLRRAIVEDVVIEYDTGSATFTYGDILLVSKYFCQRDRLQRGDMVMYGIESQTFHINPHHTGGNYDNVYIPAMRVIDRILGVAGDIVEFRADGIYVNGDKLAAGMGPVNSSALPREARFEVPAASYLVYPSCLRATYPNRLHDYPATGIKLQQSVVSAQRIVGHVFMLYCPLGKRRFF